MRQDGNRPRTTLSRPFVTPAAVLGDAAQEDSGIAQDVIAWSHANWAGVFNSGVHPSLSCLYSLADNRASCHGLRSGVLWCVVEEVVKLGVAKAVQFKPIVGSGDVGVENEVGLAVDDMRIVGGILEGEGWREALVGDPWVLDVRQGKLADDMVDGSA